LVAAVSAVPAGGGLDPNRRRVRAALAEEYRQLLHSRGLADLLELPFLSDSDIERVKRQARQSAVDYGEDNLLLAEIEAWEAAGRPYNDRGWCAEAAERIEAALTALGHPPPNAVLAGEYPHHSLNAQALAVRNGTFLLVNTGVHGLLTEVALALFARMVMTEADGRPLDQIRLPKQMRRRVQCADEQLVSTLAAYIRHGDLRRGGRQPVDGTVRGRLAFRCADAAATFALAHEYGHLMAGHLTGAARRTGDDWLRKSREQELEADEIGMTLVLRAVGPALIEKGVAVAGTFLFFGVDHLLTRVRDEVAGLPSGAIVADHPPSDVRARTLRRTLTDDEGPDVFEMADIVVGYLAGLEDKIVNGLRVTLSPQDPGKAAPREPRIW
jgi:hypothetical protein